MAQVAELATADKVLSLYGQRNGTATVGQGCFAATATEERTIMNNESDFEGRVRRFVNEKAAIDKPLQTRGRMLVDLLASQIGLRELARRIGQNPPNVCALRNGTRRISPAVYLKLCETWWAEWNEDDS